MTSKAAKTRLTIGGLAILFAAGLFYLLGNEQSSLSGHAMPEILPNKKATRYTNGHTVPGATRGDYGDVFTALDKKSGAKVVLKFENNSYRGEHYQPGQTARNELKVMQALKECPFVVQLVDGAVSDKDQIPVIVMPYYEGGDLAHYLETADPKARLHAINVWLPQIVQAMNCIHQTGYQFMDLKPANIVISKDQKQAFITDFGLARQVAQKESIHHGDSWMLGMLVLKIIGFDTDFQSMQIHPPEALGKPFNEPKFQESLAQFLIMGNDGLFSGQAQFLTNLAKLTLSDDPGKRVELNIEALEKLKTCQPGDRPPAPRSDGITYGDEFFCNTVLEEMSVSGGVSSTAGPTEANPRGGKKKEKATGKTSSGLKLPCCGKPQVRD